MLDVVSFESDCKRLSELGGEKVADIVFLGGEPLLYPQLMVAIGAARGYFPYARIKILTNGTLLLKQEESFWECCKSNNVWICITHYPIKLDIKSIRDMIKKYGLTLRYYTKQPWYKMGFDLSGKYDPRENYRKCALGLQCAELRDGKITICSVVLKMRYFNNYFQQNLELADADVIDIYKAESMDEILEFIANPVPFCRYCNVKWVPIKWRASKREISEWV
jgi:hypothetical protein